MRFGDYELHRRIGVGGMGEVFVATRVQGNVSGHRPQLALKRILPYRAADPQFIALFLEEARIAARLSHPNIVQVFELGEVDGAWFMVMEFVDGADLSRLGPVTPSEACRIAQLAALGLDYAHKIRDAQGRLMRAVHRDVSPQNVLVSKEGAVKLVDFGVTRALGGGRPAYRSPEQADGDDGDARSDQFSLGVVLWELLMGRSLFEADEDAATLARVLACEVPPPPVATDVVMRALSKDPKRRFPDCKAFAEALRYDAAP